MGGAFFERNFQEVAWIFTFCVFVQRIRAYFPSSKIIVGRNCTSTAFQFDLRFASSGYNCSTIESECARAIRAPKKFVTYLVDLVDEPGEFLGLHDDNCAFPGFTRCSYFPVPARPDPTRPSRFPVLDRVRSIIALSRSER